MTLSVSEFAIAIAVGEIAYGRLHLETAHTR